MELKQVTSKIIEDRLREIGDLTDTGALKLNLPRYSDLSPYLSEYSEDELGFLPHKKGDYQGFYQEGEKTFLYFFEEGKTAILDSNEDVRRAALSEASVINSSVPMLSLRLSHQISWYLPLRLLELGLPQSYFQRKAKWLKTSYDIIRVGGAGDSRGYLSHEETIQILFLIMRQGDIRGHGVFRRHLGFYDPIPDAKNPIDLFTEWRRLKKSRGNRRGGIAAAKKRNNASHSDEMGWSGNNGPDCS